MIIARGKEKKKEKKKPGKTKIGKRRILGLGGC